MLGIKDYDVVEMPTFNESRYQFDFIVYNENQHDDENNWVVPRNNFFLFVFIIRLIIHLAKSILFLLVNLY